MADDYITLMRDGHPTPFSLTRPLCFHAFRHEFDMTSEQIRQLMVENKALVPSTLRKSGEGVWHELNKTASGFQAEDMASGDPGAIFFFPGAARYAHDFTQVAFDLEDLFQFGKVKVHPHDLFQAYRRCTYDLLDGVPQDREMTREEARAFLRTEAQCQADASRFGSLTRKDHVRKYVKLYTRFVYEIRDIALRSALGREQLLALAAKAIPHVTRLTPLPRGFAHPDISWERTFVSPGARKLGVPDVPEVLVFGKVPLRAAKFFCADGMWHSAHW